MKNTIIASFSAVILLGGAVAANAAAPYAAPSQTIQFSTYEDRILSNADWVAQANGISREEAIAHIRHGLDSQAAKINPKTIVDPMYSPTYNPAYNAIQQNGNGFYAGLDLTTGAARFTDAQRHQLLEGVYTYCPMGQRYVYQGDTSSCQ